MAASTPPSPPKLQQQQQLMLLNQLRAALLHISASGASAAAPPPLPNPPGCKKRAAVALIVRVRPHPQHWPPGPTPTFTSTQAHASSQSHPPPHTHDNTHMRRGSGDGSDHQSNNINGNDDADVGEADAESEKDGLISAFFRQEWVQHGDAEVLFIKRAARAGDRWTSHVALPGGKRDEALDVDDCATAVRETWEEVGLVLGKHSSRARENDESEGNGDGKAVAAKTGIAAYHVGKLPERVVTTSWGKGAEVSSAHWVPLRALLAPFLRTVYRCDVSDRLARTRGRLAKRMLRLALGRMCFAAVRLLPAESTFDTFQAPDFLRLEYSAQPASQTPSAPPGRAAGSRDNSDARSTNGSLAGRLRVFLQRCAEKVWFGLPGVATYYGDAAHAGALGMALGQVQALTQPPPPPLLLWGLTLGIVVDFAQLVAPQAAQGLWRYPTFSAPDVHVWLVLLSRAFRRRKLREVVQGVGGYSSRGNRREASVGGEDGERGDTMATEAGRRGEGEKGVERTAHYRGNDDIKLAAIPTVPIAVDEGLDAVRPFFTHDPLQEGKKLREAGQRQRERNLASLASPSSRETRWIEMPPVAPAAAHTLSAPDPRCGNTSLVGVMLDGYYDIVRKAVVAAILARLVVVFMGLLGLCYLLFLRGET